MTLTEPSSHLSHYAGETSAMVERLIVAPSVGTFRLTSIAFVGAFVDEGQCIGVLTSMGKEHRVLSRFAGQLQGVMAHDGERIREGQPIAWIRTA